LPTFFQECPHEWGHGSLKGYATVLFSVIDLGLRLSYI
jgi:hypothetical protein